MCVLQSGIFISWIIYIDQPTYNISVEFVFELVWSLLNHLDTNKNQELSICLFLDVRYTIGFVELIYNFWNKMNHEKNKDLGHKNWLIWKSVLACQFTSILIGLYSISVKHFKRKPVKVLDMKNTWDKKKIQLT